LPAAKQRYTTQSGREATTGFAAAGGRPRPERSAAKRNAHYPPRRPARRGFCPHLSTASLRLGRRKIPQLPRRTSKVRQIPQEVKSADTFASSILVTAQTNKLLTFLRVLGASARVILCLTNRRCAGRNCILFINHVSCLSLRAPRLRESPGAQGLPAGRGSDWWEMPDLLLGGGLLAFLPGLGDDLFLNARRSAAVAGRPSSRRRNAELQTDGAGQKVIDLAMSWDG